MRSDCIVRAKHTGPRMQRQIVPSERREESAAVQIQANRRTQSRNEATPPLEGAVRRRSIQGVMDEDCRRRPELRVRPQASHGLQVACGSEVVLRHGRCFGIQAGSGNRSQTDYSQTQTGTEPVSNPKQCARHRLVASRVRRADPSLYDHLPTTHSLTTTHSRQPAASHSADEVVAHLESECVERARR